MNGRILTLATIEEHQACNEQRDRFQKLFGDQVEVTVERFSEPDVTEARFDYGWAAEKLLSGNGEDEYYTQLQKRREQLIREQNVEFWSEVSHQTKIGVYGPIWAAIYIKEGQEEVPEATKEIEEVSDGG